MNKINLSASAKKPIIKNCIEKVILIGGRAGQGTAVTSHFIGKVFCDLGYYVFNYRDYPSLIRGGHNFNVLKVSDKPVYSHENKYDVIVAFDQNTIDLHEKNLKEKGFVLGDQSFKSQKRFYQIDIQPILKDLQASQIIENDILIGWFFKYFGLEKEFILKEAQDKFGGSKIETIKKAIEIGYDLASQKETFKRNGKTKYFISGSDAISIGAIASGLDIYIAYPMTPATPVLHFLASKQIENNMLVLQIENEIAVANAALGASFAGAKTMVGTSGGGFALMTEAMSLAGISEIPLFVYLSQRAGPASGVPTYTAQADLKFALSAGHGEFPRIVVAPGDSKESIKRTQEALYLSLKYRTLAVLMGDKHVAESDYSFDELEYSNLSKDRFILENPDQNHKNYEITENGVSARIIPGQGPIARATSYEHNEYGNTTEDPLWTVKMNDKRLRKVKYINEEIMKLEPVKVHGKGQNLIVGWGSTKGAIIDALPDLKDFRFLQISYLSPFPKQLVEKELKKSKRVILVENSATGLLADVIAEKTGYLIKEKVLKYDARPFTPRDIIKGIKKQ